ncbi:PEP-CTERM sorting domain-containing protein [Oxalobacteraceae bacterium]|nr:PEP-CTERM sorting domain-containing protein [Oxalobacteraceae bacterium]
MMTHLRPRFCLAALSAVLLAGSAGAVPQFEAGRELPPAPPAAKTPSCSASVAAVMIDRDGARVIGHVLQTQPTPDWLGGNASAWSAHAQQVLHGDGRTDMDGLNSPCRLVDSSRAKDARLNEGENVAELLAQIDEWLELNRKRGEQNKDTVDSGVSPVLDLELDDDGRHWQAFLIQDQGLQDLGSLSGLSPLQPFDDGLELVLKFRADGSVQAVARHSGLSGFSPEAGDAATASAVPEPAAWATLMAGLALLGWRRRARRCA